MVAVSESREITRVAYLCQITNIGSSCGGKLVKECSLEGQDISVRNWDAKKVAFSELRGIALVAYVGQITNNGSGCT